MSMVSTPGTMSGRSLSMYPARPSQPTGDPQRPIAACGVEREVVAALWVDGLEDVGVHVLIDVGRGFDNFSDQCT
jgi:hypothetical protein